MVEDGTERVVAAFMASLSDLFRALPGGRWEESEQLVCYRSDIGAARFSGVAVLGPRADETLASAWLDELADQEVPHCVIERPGAPAWTVRLAERHGLTEVDEEPLMVLEDPGDVAEPDGGDLVLERVDPADAIVVGTVQQVMADGFGGPVEVLGALMSADVLGMPGVEAWLGRVDGVPCTVGLGAVLAGHVGVFNIATPAEHRGRGYGHAVTARVVASGVAAGARTAYLQASALGYPIYERMGFRTVERWPARYPA
jgi:ribosomal protein S18 acetylase RimI-like enzyme